MFRKAGGREVKVPDRKTLRLKLTQIHERSIATNKAVTYIDATGEVIERQRAGEGVVERQQQRVLFPLKQYRSKDFADYRVVKEGTEIMATGRDLNGTFTVERYEHLR